MLSKTANEAILVRIAENRNTWPSTLMRMVEHPSHSVRMAVADNPNTPESVMMSLAMDSHTDVRHAVAENANLTQTLLECLAADENCHVAARAKKSIARQRHGADTVSLPDFSKAAKRTIA
jgi:hypothetical protein